jgi:3-phosphoshikimate 1-carboxyvinyltransferase
MAHAPPSLPAALALLGALGIQSTQPSPGVCRIEGRGPFGLVPPSHALDASGVPALCRGLLGVLAAQPFASTLGPFEAEGELAADLELLRARGAHASAHETSAHVGPQTGPLRGQSVALPQPASLTKHMVLMAGLFSEEPTTVSEPLLSADHTERMLDAMGAQVRAVGSVVSLVPKRPPHPLAPFDFEAPGSLAAGAYLLAAAAILPESHVTLRGVTLNPTRSGFLEALRCLGAGIGITPKAVSLGEPQGEVSLKYRSLTGGKLGGEPMLRLDHEAHALAVVAAHATGETRLMDLGLVLSESEIAKLVGFLRSFGVQAEGASDAVYIVGNGARPFRASQITTGGDPRLAAMGMLLGLGAEGESVVDDVDSLVEFLPRFVGTLRALGAQMEVLR